jgi:hypothetical protein
MYGLQEQEALRKSNVALDPLNITYQGGQINSSVTDYNVSATTGFQFSYCLCKAITTPGSKHRDGAQELNLTSGELKMKVANAYYQLLMRAIG